jgi:hypothetical protein
VDDFKLDDRYLDGVSHHLVGPGHAPQQGKVSAPCSRAMATSTPRWDLFEQKQNQTKFMEKLNKISEQEMLFYLLDRQKLLYLFKIRQEKKPIHSL